jgi:hypothetical protein
MAVVKWVAGGGMKKMAGVKKAGGVRPKQPAGPAVRYAFRKAARRRER